jgi:hypothetical protein
MVDLGDAPDAGKGELRGASEASAVTPQALRDALNWVREGRPPTVSTPLQN